MQPYIPTIPDDSEASVIPFLTINRNKSWKKVSLLRQIAETFPNKVILLLLITVYYKNKVTLLCKIKSTLWIIAMATIVNLKVHDVYMPVHWAPTHTLTCLGKSGICRGVLMFLISDQKQRLWVLVETTLMMWFWWALSICLCSRN